MAWSAVFRHGLLALFAPHSFCIMDVFFALVKGLPVLAACVMASASYPPKPADLTTPVQQRIAINGPNGKFELYPKLSCTIMM
jgi:hypothetical protein